jgi:hypothetical protein
MISTKPKIKTTLEVITVNVVRTSAIIICILIIARSIVMPSETMIPEMISLETMVPEVMSLKTMIPEVMLLVIVGITTSIR